MDRVIGLVEEAEALSQRAVPRLGHRRLSSLACIILISGALHDLILLGRSPIVSQRQYGRDVTASIAVVGGAPDCD